MKKVEASKTKKAKRTSSKAKEMKTIDPQTEKDVSRLFDQLSNSESKYDTSSLDAKLSSRINELGYPELSSRITNNNRSNSSKKNSSWFASRAWGNLLIATMVILLMLVTTASIYLWPQGDSNRDIDLHENPTTDLATPTALLRPTVLTDSGYVSPESSFQITTTSQLEDPESLITIVPEIQFEVNTVETINGEIIEVIPDQPLEKGQKYTISLAGSVIDEGTNTDPLEWVVPVEPDLEIVSISPVDGAKDIPLDTTFEVELNHKNIDTDTASEFITVSPEVEFETTISGDLLLIEPLRSLAPDTRYTLTVFAGLRNSRGESLGDEHSVTFTTVNADPMQTGLNWEEPTDEVVINRSVIARARSDGSEKITYELYEINANSIDGQVEALTGTTADGSVQPLTSDELTNGEYFIYENAPPATYLVVADDGVSRIGQKIVVSSMMVHFAPTDVLLIGWVFDADSGVALSDIDVQAISGSQTDNLKTNRDGYFAVPETATRIMIDRGSEVLTLEAPFIDIPPATLSDGPQNDNSLVQIYFDKPEYAQGDRVNYYVPISEMITHELLVDEKDNFTLEIRGGNSSEGELLLSETVSVNDPSAIKGSFLIENAIGVEYFRIELIHGGRSLNVSNIRIRSAVSGEMSISADKDEMLLGESIKFSLGGYGDAGIASLRIYRTPISNVLSEKAKNGDELWGEMEKVVNEQITLDADGSTDYLYTPFVNDPRSDQHLYYLVLNSEPNTGSKRAEINFKVYETATNIEITADRSVVTRGDFVDINFSSRQMFGNIQSSDIQLELTLMRSDESHESSETEYDPYLDSEIPIEASVLAPDEVQVDKRELTIKPAKDVSVRYEDLDAGIYSLRVKHSGTEEEFITLFTVVESLNELSPQLEGMTMTQEEGSVRISIESESGGEGEVDALIYLSDDPENYQIGTPGSLRIQVTQDNGVVCVAYPRVGLYSTIWVSGCTQYGVVLGVESDDPKPEVVITEQVQLLPGE